MKPLVRWNSSRSVVFPLQRVCDRTGGSLRRHVPAHLRIHPLLRHLQGDLGRSVTTRRRREGEGPSVSAVCRDDLFVGRNSVSVNVCLLRDVTNPELVCRVSYQDALRVLSQDFKCCTCK